MKTTRELLSPESAREIQQRSISPNRMDKAVEIANKVIKQAAGEGRYSCNLHEAKSGLSDVEEEVLIKLLEESGYTIKHWWTDVSWEKQAQ